MPTDVMFSAQNLPPAMIQMNHHNAIQEKISNESSGFIDINDDSDEFRIDIR